MRLLSYLRDVPAIRSPIMRIRALRSRPELTTGTLTTVMYHDVPADTRPMFAQQLDYMRSLGDFLTVSQAVELLHSGAPISGRYFCVTFDDGEKNAFDNALPLLAERGIPSTFFVVPSWISAADRRYMTWDECRQLVDAGSSIGSHSLSHRRFSALDDRQARHELAASKARVEAELGAPCDHFACPWGQPRADYLVERDPGVAAEAGYKSFFTTIRGSARRGASRWAIPRVRLEPGWGLHQLRYLFAR